MKDFTAPIGWLSLGSAIKRVVSDLPSCDEQAAKEKIRSALQAGKKLKARTAEKLESETETRVLIRGELGAFYWGLRRGGAKSMKDGLCHLSGRYREFIVVDRAAFLSWLSDFTGEGSTYIPPSGLDETPAPTSTPDTVAEGEGAHLLPSGAESAQAVPSSIEKEEKLQFFVGKFIEKCKSAQETRTQRALDTAIVSEKIGGRDRARQIFRERLASEGVEIKCGRPSKKGH